MIPVFVQTCTRTVCPREFRVGVFAESHKNTVFRPAVFLKYFSRQRYWLYFIDKPAEIVVFNYYTHLAVIIKPNCCYTTDFAAI